MLDEPVSWTVFGERMLRHRDVKLRNLLLDRTVIAGIGPVYADEILYASGCVPTAGVVAVDPGDPPLLPRRRGDPARGGQAPWRHHLRRPVRRPAGKPGGWTASCRCSSATARRAVGAASVVSKVASAASTIYLCEACQV
jgi:formamidopyrimidine-DNA glycosylase